MAGLIVYTCPNCGGTAQIEAGRDAMCPYCACMRSVPQKSDKAFAQDVQFAPPPAQQVQPQQDPAQGESIEEASEGTPAPKEGLVGGWAMNDSVSAIL